MTAPILVTGGTGNLGRLVVARLVATGADPRLILSVTFTNKAAGELRERVGRLLHVRTGYGGGGLWVGTFHSVSARLLRQWGTAVGLRKDSTSWAKATAAGVTVKEVSEAAAWGDVVVVSAAIKPDNVEYAAAT